MSDSGFLRLLDQYRDPSRDGSRDDSDPSLSGGRTRERIQRRIQERYWSPPDLGPFDGFPDRVDLDDAWEWLEEYGDVEWGRHRASERYHFRIDSVGGEVHFIEIAPLLGLLRIKVDLQMDGSPPGRTTSPSMPRTAIRAGGRSGIWSGWDSPDPAILLP